MTGLNKFTDKAKRQQRRLYQHDHMKADLRTPKYRQRTIERKRIDDEEGNYFFIDRYYDEDEEIEW